MPPPKRPSRGFSFFGLAGVGNINSSIINSKNTDRVPPAPSLKLETDRDVYRPGDLVTITIQIKNPTGDAFSLLVERLSFEIKGIEKLDTQWFTTPKPSPESKQRRGEYVFMECSTPSIVSNQIISAGATKKYVVRTLLPGVVPPSYRGATIRYLYYVRSTLSGQYLMMENGHFPGESIRDLSELEARTPLQIWVTQKTNGLLIEQGKSDGIVPDAPIVLDVYWKAMEGESDWARANETYDGVEEGYESSRDEISSVSSHNHTKENIHKTFGSSLSLQSSLARFSNKDSPYPDEYNSISSHTVLPRLSVAEVFYDSRGDVLSLQKSSAIVSPSQQLNHAKFLPTVDESRSPSTAAEGFVRGRSYNIRLDDQVLLRFCPKNSDSTYYFSDMIGGTLTFFHEEKARRCLELLITLELSESVSRHSVHPSRRNSPTITKVFSDHHEVVADLVQTSFFFSIPMDGPMSFSTHHVSVQWALRFEFFTTAKNVDCDRYDHPLLVEGREKCEWILPITVHAPPQGTAAAHTQNESPLSLEPLWVQT